MILMSDTIKGAGCTKGGAFMSGYSEFRDEENKDADFFADRALDYIDDLEIAGRIDSTANFETGERAVIVLSGEDDRSVPPHNIEAIFKTY